MDGKPSGSPICLYFTVARGQTFITGLMSHGVVLYSSLKAMAKIGQGCTHIHGIQQRPRMAPGHATQKDVK